MYLLPSSHLSYETITQTTGPSNIVTLYDVTILEHASMYRVRIPLLRHTGCVTRVKLFC
jgi:hypothetical protein